MATVNRTILGFLTGTAAALSIAQGGSTPRYLPTGPGGWGVSVGQKSMTLTVQEDVTGSEGLTYAPHAVTVEAFPVDFPANSNSHDKYDALMWEVMYHIDFGDEVSNFVAPQKLPTEFKDRNISVSKKSTHVYRTPGTYAITVHAYDYLGNWAVQTYSVTVRANDFTSANTIVMDTSGSFAGAPSADAANQVTTWAAMDSRARALLATQSVVKIYGKYGDTYDPTGVGMWLSLYPNVVMDAWGTPANGKPIVDFSTGAAEAPFTIYNAPADFNRQLKISNWDIQSRWDSTTELFDGNFGNYGNMVVKFAPQAGHVEVIFDKVDMSGFSFGVFTSSLTTSVGDTRIVMHDSSFTNFRDLFIAWLPNTTTISHVGMYIRQPDNCMNGAESYWSAENGRNKHNSTRNDADADHIYHNCDLQARHGWSPNNAPLDQALFRMATNGNQTEMRFFCSRSFLQGGFSFVSWDTDMHPLQAVVESCQVLTNALQGGTSLGSETTGPLFRNNLFTIVNTPHALALYNPTDTFVALGSSELSATDKLTPFGFQSNTFVDLRTTANAPGTWNGIITEGTPGDLIIVDENNVWSRPALDTPTGATNLSRTDFGYEGDYSGFRVGWERWTGTISGGDVAPSGTLLVPYGNDWNGNALTLADFSGAKARSFIAFGTFSLMDHGANPAYTEVNGDISVSFGASGVTFTNLSADTWTNGSNFIVHVDRSTNAMALDTNYATPAGSADTFAVTATSDVYQTATGNVPPLDFLGDPRVGSNHPNAPAGTASPGHLVV